MANDFKNLTGTINQFSGITSDSREVKPGFIFVATKGGTTNGHDYIPEAVEKGAKVVVGELPAEGFPGIYYIRAEDSRQALGTLASEFYDNPSHKLRVIGVTGTKGKTTTSHLIYHILTSLGERVGLVSSIMAKIGDQEIDTGFHVTSPDVVSLHKFLKEMVDAGCKYAVVEVSSHGIDQKRIAGVNFEIGVLTNIAPEHLDYHKTFAEYKRVKMSFINSCKIKVIAPKETKTNILPGIFNNLNVDAAIETVEKLGFDKKKAFETLDSFELPKGRLEEIKNDKGIKIFVDFAHTPDSLDAALKYLRTQTKGRLISVFGCAGERDKKKRFKMGKISVQLADYSIFTAEDPRSENIFDILTIMMHGAKSAGGVENKNFVRIPERGEAIAHALSIAKSGDVVGFFGKGHETSMAYKGFEHPWSDRLEIENFLEKDDKTSAVILAAGKGTRMRSQKPKIIHEICGRPMISYSLQNLRQSKIGEIVAVVSYRKNLVIRKIGGNAKIAVQKNPKGGTADSLSAGLPSVSAAADKVVVMYGDDTAFYSANTIKRVIETHIETKSILTFVTLIKEDPHGLGRIIRDKNGTIAGIVEEKDATEVERKIKEINDGMYVFEKKWLEENLVKVEKSPVTGEYYIPELIKMAIGQKQKVSAYRLPNSIEWQGINTPEELVLAEEKMKNKLLQSNEYKN